MTLPLTYLGHPLLRQTAQTVTVSEIQEQSFQELVAQLLITLTSSNGVGIAAPQVGQSLQLIIVASHPNPRYPHAPAMDPVVMINPWIVHHSQQVEKGWEGCLSVPGQRGLVPRYESISVEYLTPRGSKEQRVFNGFVARIIQHECDHLQGLFFLDRMEPWDQPISEGEYRGMNNQLNPLDLSLSDPR